MGNDGNYTLTDYQKGFNQLQNFVKFYYLYDAF